MKIIADVTNFDEYNNVAIKVKDIVGADGLNLLVNNAGITTKFTRINMVKLEQMMDNYTINTVAPLMLTKVKNLITDVRFA